MGCDEVGKHLADRLKGELDEPARTELARHLQTCAACRSETEALEDIWARLGDLTVAPMDDVTARARFDERLDDYREVLGDGPAIASAASRVPARWRDRPAWQATAAAALLAVGVASGAAFVRPPAVPPPAELGELRRELHEVREMLTLSLMQQQSASERLRGVSWSHQIDQPGGEIVGALLDTLLHDPNVNVRLAAVDALRRFSGQEAVHKGTLAALSDSSVPLVQIALIDYAVETKETDAIETLRRLSLDARANEAVREHAAWGLQQLRS